MNCHIRNESNLSKLLSMLSNLENLMVCGVVETFLKRGEIEMDIGLKGTNFNWIGKIERDVEVEVSVL